MVRRESRAERVRRARARFVGVEGAWGVVVGVAARER